MGLVMENLPPAAWADALRPLGALYRASVGVARATAFGMLRTAPGDRALFVAGRDRSLSPFRGDERTVEVAGENARVRICPWTPDNVRELVRYWPNLVPEVPPRQGFSFGFGCRCDAVATRPLGRLVLRFAEDELHATLAQQSNRENSQTGRTPEDVVLDTQRALFEIGWHRQRDHGGRPRPYSCDADHQQAGADDPDLPDLTKRWKHAGATLFTCDVRQGVSDRADGADRATVLAMCQQLDWHALRLREADFLRRYSGRTERLETASGPYVLTLGEEVCRRFLAKYATAAIIARDMFDRLVSEFGGHRFAFEVSLDETHRPTTPEEHFLFASLLSDFGVKPWSLAPRLPGRLEKGIDYVPEPGRSLGDFAPLFALHAAVAKRFGYRISLHSGSDKFSLYGTMYGITGGSLHIKTAGTWFLCLLKVAALKDPELFRTAYRDALEYLPEGLRHYEITAKRECIPEIGSMRPEEYPALLYLRHPRQMLHIGYRRILENHREALRSLVNRYRALHDLEIDQHALRHLDAVFRGSENEALLAALGLLR